MANPTLVHPEKRDDRSNITIDAGGFAVAGVQILGSQKSTVADAAALTAYTAHASGATAVVSNAATDLDTVAAALKTMHTEVVALRVQVVAMNAVLEDHGLSKDA